MEVRKANGIHLPGCDVWLDSLRSRPLGVVTHAHSDHAAWHAETVVTPATAALMRARRGFRNKVIHETAFDEPRNCGAARITLLPAGHVLGSAQVFLECEAGTVLYTGDFKRRSSLTSERTQTVRADVLIMECTFGRPRYRFPDREEIQAAIVRFCQDAVEDRHVPVLLAYSIGKAQELMAMLRGTGLKVVMHEAVFKMAKVYEAFGARFGEFEEYDGRNHAGCIMIYPPHVRDQLAHIPKTRTAIASGWALDSGAIYRYRCDAAFPLSDHADYEELLQHVEEVGAQRVYTVHGFTEEFARDLRRIGVDALALGGVNQLELGL